MNKLSGVLLVDKPASLSSAAVVAKIKNKFSIDKIGHGGTLDPFATGLLVLLLGEATKISRFFLGGKKTYLCTAKMGQETDTGDLTGKILTEDAPAMLGEQNFPTLADWENTRSQFLGKIMQTPPQYSALKHKGKALYEYARKGEYIPLEARAVEITDLEILSYEPPFIRFRVSCSGGTYIRSLAQDWARGTNTRAHLTRIAERKKFPVFFGKSPLPRRSLTKK